MFFACLYWEHLWHWNYIQNYIQITSVMSKPIFLMTVQEAHKEYNSLMDQIRAKYEQLDSGEYGTVDTPAFKAEACELANLLVRMSQLCQKLNLPPPKELYRPMVFKHWRHFSDQNYTRQEVWLGYGGCSFVCRSEHPLSFKNWGLAVHLACNHSCSLTSPRKLLKLPPKTDWWWTAKPLRQKAQIAFPPGRGERPLYTEYNSIWQLQHLRHEWDE